MLLDDCEGWRYLVDMQLGEEIPCQLLVWSPEAGLVGLNLRLY